MSQSSGAILRTVESGFFIAPPKAHPANIYVVSYHDGHTRAFTGIPSATDRWGSKFCYIVDTAERRVRDSLTVPTMTDAYSFTIDVEATYKVTDAEAVVRANLTDGNEVVLARLRDELWMIGRDHSPEDAAGAEMSARSALSQPMNLDVGVTIRRTMARFTVDSRLTAAVIEFDQDTHQGRRDEQKMIQLRRLVDGSDEAMVMLHLLKHPDDTGTVLQMMAEARDKNQAVQFGLLDRMLEHNLITDADAQPLRERVLGQPAPQVTMRPITSRATTPPLTSITGAPPAAKVHTVSDAPTPTPASSPQPVVPAQPDPQPAPAQAPSSGGVKKWKSVKKSAGQEPE